MTRRKANRGRTTPKKNRSTKQAASNRARQATPTTGSRSTSKPSVNPIPDGKGATDSTEDDLIPLISQALEDHPFALLSLASVMIVEIIEASPQDLDSEVSPVRGIELLAAGMIESQAPEQVAFGLVLAALSLDKEMPDRVGARVNSTDGFPAWISQLDHTKPAVPCSMNHILGDDQNLFVGVSFGNGLDATIVVYVDHLIGSAVKEVTLTPEPVGAVVGHFVESMEADEASFHELDPANTRAFLEAAIEASLTLPAEHQTENWPRFRPLLAWAVSLLPDGGTAPPRAENQFTFKGEVIDEFLADAGAELTPSEERFADLLVDFKTRTGNRNAILWSPISVEVALVHSLAGQAQNLDDNYRQLPDVLRTLIRWCHQQASVPEHLTKLTLESVDEFEDQFLSSIVELISNEGAPWLDEDEEESP